MCRMLLLSFFSSLVRCGMMIMNNDNCEERLGGRKMNVYHTLTIGYYQVIHQAQTTTNHEKDSWR
jgi:hypothetical protein